ncbi:MAG: tetratricopeptide repeat protein [Candidatus Krumholzibacteriia bacterium]
MIRRVSLAALLGAALLWTGCATPYMKAQQAYFKGDPATAEIVLAPVAQKETEKNGKLKNLYLWDMGIYRFSQGDYDGAIEVFMQSVKDAERIHDAGETMGAAVTSAASQQYVGDPVEISMAYLYLGTSYFMKGDYQNALIGFRRSIEEDLSKDEARRGDMGITNFLLGECYSRTGNFDDAVVAYRRAIQHEENLVPAYASLYWALKKQGNGSDVARIQEEIEKRAGKGYLESIDGTAGQGIIVAMFAGQASRVKGDMFLGAFRQRDEFGFKVASWEASINPADPHLALFPTDNMHEHFKDQGGMGDEAKKQATRLVASKAMSAIPILGLFAPSTKADLRFWPTLPGTVHVGYLPTQPGSYNISVKAYDKNQKPLSGYFQTWAGVIVPENRRALVVLTSWRSASYEKAR